MSEINLMGIQPEVRDLLRLQAKFNGGDTAVVIKTADVAPVPTAAIWSYLVEFELQTAAGEVLPYTGNVASSVAATSIAGTPATSDATPAVEMGKGSVTISGDAAAWLDSETATLTVTFTNAYAVAKTADFVVTFTT